MKKDGECLYAFEVAASDKTLKQLLRYELASRQLCFEVPVLPHPFILPSLQHPSLDAQLRPLLVRALEVLGPSP